MLAIIYCLTCNVFRETKSELFTFTAAECETDVAFHTSASVVRDSQHNAVNIGTSIFRIMKCISLYLLHSRERQWADKVRGGLWQSSTDVRTWITTMEALPTTEKPNINNLCCFMLSPPQAWHQLLSLPETPHDSVLHGKDIERTGFAIVRWHAAKLPHIYIRILNKGFNEFDWEKF